MKTLLFVIMNYCTSIEDHGQRYYCMAMENRNISYCVHIEQKDLRRMCMAVLRNKS